MRISRFFISSFAVFVLAVAGAARGEEQPGTDWRALALIQGDKVDPAWVQIGYGSFVVDDGSLRTECDERGLGLLVYRKEKFGDCQLRVVYRSKDARSNSGVYVRIDDGILKQIGKDSPTRDAGDNRTREQIFMEASEKEQGPWYAVHRGFEVQICDAAGDKRSRTAAVYSLAESTALSDKQRSEWKTMIITLKGTEILVDIDGQRVTTFDSDSKDLPPDRKWYQPKREPKRPTSGYIGLQTHDPGDVVSFKEISVRALTKAQ